MRETERQRQRAEEERRNEATRRAAKEQLEQRQRQAAAAQAEAQAQKQRQDHEVWTAFATEYNVQELVSLSKLVKNPFVYEGKILATNAWFREMESRDTAVLSTRPDDVLELSGVPSGLFTEETRVVVAGKVVGKGNGRTKMRFVGAHICPKSSSLSGKTTDPLCNVVLDLLYNN